jgi:hypothetical protein
VLGGGNIVTRTLEDTLVAAIQQAPCQPLAKLALADLLEERDDNLESRALRWCADNRKWPQRRGYLGEYKVIPVRDEKPTGYLWQWWHFSVDAKRRSFKGRWRLRPTLSAIIPDDVGGCWLANGIWSHPTWFAALTALGLALKQLEESNNNDCYVSTGETLTRGLTMSLTAPTGVAATRESITRVDVTWNPDLQSEGFQVYRSTNGGMSYDQLVDEGTAAAFSYSDNAAPAGNIYWYKVRVYNSSGYSQFSSPVSAT